MACGRPVVALGRGGATETVVPGVSGALVETQSADAFATTMDQIRHTSHDSFALARHAARFSTEQFEQGLRLTLTRALSGTSPC
jgi:glycosyltransferase involved in cell wall biosynthesis